MRLNEITDTPAARVDREQNTLHDVRILGTFSRNGRTYPADTLRKAAGLYEGKVVNVDHADPGSRRSYADRIGRLVNVQLRSDGLYGDLQFNPKHPLAEQLAWDAEHAPGNVGLSHDAEGKTRRDGETVVVEEIERVYSVDLVADPATTRGLFESYREPTMKTVAKIVAENKKSNQQAARLAKLLEQDGMEAVADAPVEMAAEADPNAEVVAAFEKAAIAILKKWFAGEIEETDAISKLKELGGMKAKAEETADTETTVAAEPAAESVKRLRAEIDARDLLEEAGVKSSKARVNAIVSAASDADRKELLESWKVPETATREKPRSGSTLKESGRLPEIKDTKDFARALRE